MQNCGKATVLKSNSAKLWESNCAGEATDANCGKDAAVLMSNSAELLKQSYCVNEQQCWIVEEATVLRR